MVANHTTDNFDDESFRRIPNVPDTDSRLSLTRLRKIVQKQGRLRDARVILLFETDFLSDKTLKQEACHSLIAALGQASESEPVWAIESSVRSLLAQSLTQAGDIAAAEQENQRALDLLNQAVSLIAFSLCLFFLRSISWVTQVLTR